MEYLSYLILQEHRVYVSGYINPILRHEFGFDLICTYEHEQMFIYNEY